jgi:uncharacterized membrane protein YoaK (UPF0700 family)
MDFAPAWLPISVFMVFIGTVTRVYDNRIEPAKRRRIVLTVCALCLIMFALGVIASPSSYHFFLLVLLAVVLWGEYELISRKVIKWLTVPD